MAPSSKAALRRAGAGGSTMRCRRRSRRRGAAAQRAAGARGEQPAAPSARTCRWAPSRVGRACSTCCCAARGGCCCRLRAPPPTACRCGCDGASTGPASRGRGALGAARAARAVAAGVGPGRGRDWCWSRRWRSTIGARGWAGAAASTTARWTARDPQARLIAMVRDVEFVDELPADPHDVPMTHVITPERGVLSCGPRMGPGNDDRFHVAGFST